MGFQIGSYFIKTVIEFKVKVMCLKIRHNKNARNRPGKFTKTVIDILGLQGNTPPELFIVRHGTAPDCS